MRTNINGPFSPYKYSYKIIDEQRLLLENQTFTKMHISIYDIQASIIGNGREKIEIWWDDLSIIQDPSNNTLSEGKIIGHLSFFEYLSPEAVEAVSGGGSGVKYTILSMFSINLALRFIISSSAATMWSLIHVLQVFRYTLMMNIFVPKLVRIMLQYLVVVIGEIDELEELIPDVLNEYVLNTDDLAQNMTIYSKFEENDYETPYLTELQGKKFFIFAVVIIIFMPMIYFLKVLCNKVKH